MKPENPSRRSFLKTTLALSAASVVISALESCTPQEKEKLAGSLADLEARGFLTADMNGATFFISRRAGGELQCLNLTCTHKKCTVEWKASAQKFICPCHDGTYDAQGRRLSGPPPGPLTAYRAEVRGSDVWVLNEPL